MKFQYILLLGGAAVVLIMMTACTSVNSAAVSEAAMVHPQEIMKIVEQVDDCPVTQPPGSPFVPPKPWPVQPPVPDQFWYGDDGLWTALPRDGSWRQLALGEKFWWWSAEFDVSENSMPDLTITAKRLDGEAAPLEISEVTNGYHESFNWAMLAGVELSSPGCWEFTGHYKGHELTFVLWVPAE